MAIITFTAVGTQKVTINGTPVTVTSSSIYKINSSYVTIERTGGTKYSSERLSWSDLLEVVLTPGGDIVCRSERLDGQRQGFLSLHATELPSNSSTRTTSPVSQSSPGCAVFSMLCLMSAAILALLLI